MMGRVAKDRAHQNRALIGISLMIIGLALYPLSDAFVKHLMGTYSVHQTTFLRAITRLLPLLVTTYFQGGLLPVLGTKHPTRHLIRLSVNLAYTYAFMYAFSMRSLTVIYTLSYSSAFFMIILSALMLKETITKERWTALLLGMCGVLIAMRPGVDVFEMASYLVLIGSFLGALNKILIRQLAETEHSLAIAIYPNILMIVVTFPFLMNSWQPMPWEHLGLFAIVGGVTAAGQYAIAQALRYAECSILAPIDYSSFFWVVALDFIWWDTIPSVHSLIGTTIIAMSNLFILYRSRSFQAKIPAKA